MVREPEKQDQELCPRSNAVLLVRNEYCQTSPIGGLPLTALLLPPSYKPSSTGDCTVRGGLDAGPHNAAAVSTLLPPSYKPSSTGDCTVRGGTDAGPHDAAAVSTFLPPSYKPSSTGDCTVRGGLDAGPHDTAAVSEVHRGSVIAADVMF